MTAKAAQHPARYKLTFTNESVIGQPILSEMDRKTRVVHNIQRGVIKPESAWLEIELSGTPKNVERALTFLKAKGVTITAL